MLTRFGMHRQSLTAGVSVAVFALMTGMSVAQDTQLTDPPEPIDDALILIAGPSVDDGTGVIDETGGVDLDCGGCDLGAVGEDGEPVFYPIDPVVLEDGEVFYPGVMPGDGEPMNIDGIGDGEPLPDVVLDGEAGGVVGEEPEVTTTDFPDSNCGGCEYQNLAGGPEVQRELSGPSLGSGGHGSVDATTQAVSDENNICYNADLYIPLLCDWQRPWVGDLMP